MTPPATEPLAPDQPTVTPEFIDRLLALPDRDREALGHLLIDSVREGFTSLGDIERRDRDELRRRIESVERGEAILTDWREALARVERQLRAEFAE